MTAPATITDRRADFTVVNPDCEPTDAWIQAVARLLLAAVDRKRAERVVDVDGDKSQGGSE